MQDLNRMVEMLLKMGTQLISFQLQSRNAKPMKLHITLVVFLLSIFACSEDTTNIGYEQHELDKEILNAVEENNIPSLAACIVKNDQIVWRNTFGYQDIENKTIPSDKTAYGLASITKTFTSVAVMQLYEKDLLDLDSDINLYLPFELRNPKHPEVPITTSMLLTHTSGLSLPTEQEDPRINNRLPVDEIQKLGDWIRSYVIPGGANYVSAVWKNTIPGEVFEYSNMGISVLGHIVENVSNTDFRTYCQLQIFEPLGMTNTGFPNTELNDEKSAVLYHNNKPIPQFNVPFYPAAMLKSSMLDLSHYVIAIMNGGQYGDKRILNVSTVDKMLEITLPEAGLYGGGMALGWQGMNGQWVGHLGGFWGVSSSMTINLNNKLAVIMLTNSADNNSVYPGGYIYERLHFEALGID